MDRETSFDEFWLTYLRAHSRRMTRLIHYLGITTIFTGILLTIVTGQWWFGPGGLVAGYLIAFSGHYIVQHNRPVLFKGPRAAFWSIGCALRMYVLGVTGELGPELARAGIEA